MSQNKLTGGTTTSNNVAIEGGFTWGSLYNGGAANITFVIDSITITIPPSVPYNLPYTGKSYTAGTINASGSTCYYTFNY